MRTARSIFSGLRRRICILRTKKSGLAANIEPSCLAWGRAAKIGPAIVAATEQRDKIIAAEQLDRAFAIPNANWGAEGANDYLGAYHRLRSLDRNEIRFLRLRSQAFSGYSLLHFSRGGGTHSTDQVPQDFDKRIAHKPHQNLIDHWWKLTSGLPKRHTFRPAQMLGEVGWQLPDGTILNEDTIGYQERLSLLSYSGVLDRLPSQPRILEIGGGYGALAAGIVNALPKAKYWICDLPESLLFSGLYLSLTRGEHVQLRRDDEGPSSEADFNLIPNYLFSRLTRRFDLVINTLSLSEMTEHQISTYGAGIAKLLAENGVFFEQNHDNRIMGLSYCKPIISGFFSKRRPLQPPFPVTHGMADLWSRT